MLTSNHMDNTPDQAVPSKPTAESKRTLLLLAIPLAILLAGGAAVAIWLAWPRPNAAPKTPQPTGQTTATPQPNAPEPGPPAATTTPAATSTSETAPASNQPIFGADDYRRGDTAKLFLGDEIHVWEKDFPAFRVKATQFTDSRCPANVQCIWAGERGIEIEVTLEGTEALPKPVVLSETTRRTAQVSGLKMTLVKIDDAKGGTYAEIKFE